MKTTTKTILGTILTITLVVLVLPSMTHTSYATNQVVWTNGTQNIDGQKNFTSPLVIDKYAFSRWVSIGLGLNPEIDIQPQTFPTAHVRIMPANNTLSGSSILELNSQAIDGGALVMITNNTKGSYQWNSESSSGTLQVGTSGGGCNLTFYEIFADSLGARISLKDPYSNSEPCRFTDLGKPVSANDTARMNTIGNQKLSPFGSPTEDQVLTFNSNSTAIWKEPTGGPATMARNTGYWTSNAITTLATSSGTYTANVLRAHPLLVYQRESINTIGVSVTTAAAGHCRYGIYSDNGTGYPSTLISGSDKLLSPNATGIISATYSPKITLTAGKYWEAYSCDVAPSVTAIAVGAVPNVMGSKSTDFTVQGTGWNKSPYTYPVSGLPTSFPTGAALLGNTQPPFIGLKVVS